MKGVNLDQLNLLAKVVTKDRMEHALVQLRQLQSHSPGFIPGLNTFSVKGKKKKRHGKELERNFSLNKHL